jgi:hypothetical protein
MEAEGSPESQPCDGSGVTLRSIVAVCRIEHAAKATSMACANKMCIYLAPLRAR